MTVSTLQSFAHSSGQSANGKTGDFSGSLLGKIAEGLDALEAIKNLAEAKVNRFMELAAQAANIAKQTLQATRTIPYASPDVEFNPTLNVEKAAIAPKSPGLGSSTRAKKRTNVNKHKEDGS